MKWHLGPSISIHLWRRDRSKRYAFLMYLEKFLKRRQKLCECNREVDKLFLRVTAADSSSELLVQKWIDFASKSKVKRLQLHLQLDGYARFNLDHTTFFSTTLVELTITVSFIGSSSFTLPNLRALFLYDVWIYNEDFAGFIAGCPRIEVLIIEGCPEDELYEIVIPSPALKFLKLHCFCYYHTIKVESTNLESLVLGNLCVDDCEIEITSTTVKNLILEHVYSQESEAVMHFINKFLFLEKLVIDDCWQNRYVSLPNLKSFVLKLRSGGSGYTMEEMRIDAPKLKFLEYTGGLTSFPGIKGSCELEFVEFHLKPQILDTNWYIWLRNVLDSFAHSKRLSLICQNEQDIIFPDEVPDILLATINDIKNLELQIISCATTTEEILDGFIWVLPGLKTLSLTVGSISRGIEII